LRLARHDHLVAAVVGESALFRVQAQLGLPLVLVGTVAGETVIGEDRPYVAIEFDGATVRIGGKARKTKERACGNKKEETRASCTSHAILSRAGSGSNGAVWRDVAASFNLPASWNLAATFVI